MRSELGLNEGAVRQISAFCIDGGILTLQDHLRYRSKPMVHLHLALRLLLRSLLEALVLERLDQSWTDSIGGQLLLLAEQLRGQVLVEASWRIPLQKKLFWELFLPRCLFGRDHELSEVTRRLPHALLRVCSVKPVVVTREV